VDYLVKPNSDELARQLKADEQSVKSLLRVENLTIDTLLAPDKAMPSAISKLGTIYMPIKGLIDIEAEKKRLAAQLDKIRGDLERVSAKLNNISFVSKAPAEVVEQQKHRKQELVENSEKLQRLIDTLSQAS